MDFPSSIVYDYSIVKARLRDVGRQTEGICVMRNSKRGGFGMNRRRGQQDAMQNLHFSPTCGMQEKRRCPAIFLAELWPGLSRVRCNFKTTTNSLS
jgi:hypothetical protein